jgi:hypothetical protein
MSRVVFSMFAIFILFSCEKDEFSKGHGLLIPSFSEEWPVTAYFGEFKNNVYFSFNHYDDSTGLIYEIRIDYIPSIEDSTQLEYVPNIPGPDVRKPTANFYIKTDEDAIADTYEIDSLCLKTCYIDLEHITNRKITGSFGVSFQRSNHLPKYAPFIPDSFSIVNGRFTAEKF